MKKWSLHFHKNLNPTYCFSVHHRINVTCNSDLNRIFDTAKYTYCFLSDQYTDNSSFFESRHRLKAQIKKKKQYAELEFLSFSIFAFIGNAFFFTFFYPFYHYNFFYRLFLLAFFTGCSYSPFCHHCDNLEFC